MPYTIAQVGLELTTKPRLASTPWLCPCLSPLGADVMCHSTWLYSGSRGKSLTAQDPSTGSICPFPNGFPVNSSSHICGFLDTHVPTRTQHCQM